MLLVATTPSSASKADWSALLERPAVSKLCSAAMLLPCAATCPSVVARAAAVARGAIGGDSVGSGVVAGGCRVHCQVSHLSVGSQSEGQLSCCDARAVSHLSVVQDLRDVARDRSFKHVFFWSIHRIMPCGRFYRTLRHFAYWVIYNYATAPECPIATQVT